MLLFKAAEKLKRRSFPCDYEQFASHTMTSNEEATELLAQVDADNMAIRCIEAQMRLSELLNEFWDGIKEDDTMSAHLVYELLSGIRFDAKFDEDGVFDLEATEGNESQGVDKS